MPSPSHRCSLPLSDQRWLLDLARSSIRFGLAHGKPLPVDMHTVPPELRRVQATFVTLTKRGVLRGCIGTLQPIRPLAEDIACNAYAAAFNDPRFPPVTEDECAGLDLHLSLLTPQEPLRFDSEEELLGQLQPGSDGLTLEAGIRRATFLPAVWESLPNPRDFLSHLKLKAGLPSDYWSPSLRAYRYQTEVIETTSQDESPP